jgi:hypothetical protein
MKLGSKKWLAISSALRHRDRDIRIVYYLNALNCNHLTLYLSVFYSSVRITLWYLYFFYGIILLRFLHR